MSKKKRFKKRIIIIPLVCLLVVGIVITMITLNSGSSAVAEVIPVNQMMGMSYEFGQFIIDGKVKKGSTQKVAVDEDFTIDEVKVKKGDTVKKGDVLITYDTVSLQFYIDEIENNINVYANQIKIANNELNTLKGLIPSENAPATQTTTTPTESNIPVVEIPEVELFEYEKQISTNTTPVEGDGSETSPFVFNVGEDTVVLKQYMQYLAGENKTTATSATTATTNATEPTENTGSNTKANSKYAVFHIYNESGKMLYSWLVDGSKLTDSDIADWKCSQNVTISENGSIKVEQGKNLFATLITYTADESYLLDEDIQTEGTYSEDMYADSYTSDEYDYTENNMSYSGEITANDNYVYTQAELKDMISEKENEIKQKEFEKRQAEIDLKTEKKRLTEGEEVANVDGTVTFVAKSAQEAVQKGAYIIIENDTATSIIGSVTESDLPSVSVGMSATAINNITGDECNGVVTAISDEASLNNEMVSDDTVSYYDVTIELEDTFDVADSESEAITVLLDTGSDKEFVSVDKAFIRTENGKSYVMVANENDVIEKRYVELGKTYYDFSVQITSGLSSDDRVAFPYGDIAEGMPVVDTTYQALLNSGIF